MYEGDAPVKSAGMYEELAEFVKRTLERMERENAEADQAEAHAKMARHRAEQTRRVYESSAKLLDSMANVPIEPINPGVQTITFPPPPGGWQVRQ